MSGVGDQYGEFILARPVGEGGMGTVWDATHISTGTSVALKLVSSDQISASARAAFVAEVEAVARCRHPNVVRILDYGVRGDEHWYAMERVEGGDLQQSPPTSWAELHPVLVGILRGLAHVHARSITHRDLKPANVLLADVPKLSDFGLAHRKRGSNRSEDLVFVSAGTPYFMAPEQFRGSWRDFGPWTDLYALGCLTFELVSGTPPFVGQHIVDIAQNHITAPVPPLAPKFAVPQQLEGWVRTLLIKHPHERLGSAAEALALLPPADAAVDAAGAAGTSKSSLALATTLAFLPAPDPAWSAPSASEGPVAAEVQLGEAPPSGAEVRWGLERESVRLFGLRPIPVFGRAAETTAVWEALREADRRREARVVLFEGPEGCGRAQLAWWVAHLGHELAGARIFRAAHHAPAQERDGVAGMLRAALQLDGLEPQRAIQRLRELLETLRTGHLTRLASELMDLQPPENLTAPQRVGLTRRLIAAASRGRPAVVLLDDVHLNAESCAFALDAARAPDRSSAPLLVVCTADSQRPTDALDSLHEEKRVRRIPVEPLSVEETATLIRSELRVDRKVAQEVAEAADGFVEVAMQMLGDLLARGDLLPGDAGFRAAGASVLPASSSAYWKRGLEGLVRDDLELLRLGAAVVLGPRVDVAEWELVLSTLGAGSDLELVDRMVRAGLAERGHGWWVVKYAPFREVVETQLRAGGSWGELHRACAAALRGATEPRELVRLAHHCLNGGELDHALEACARAAEQALGARGRSNDTLGEALRIVDDVGERGERSASARLLIRVARAAHARNLGDPETALEYTEDWAAAGAHAARAGLIRAAALQQLGRLGGAAEVLLASLKGTLSGSERAEHLRSLATICLRRNDPDGAERYTREALRILEPGRDGIAIGWCHYRLTDLSRQRGEFRAAEHHLAHARDCFVRSGFEVGAGEAMNVAGVIKFEQGAYDEAVKAYEQAYRLLRDAGSPWAVTARLNRAFALVFAGRGATLVHEVDDLRDELKPRNFVLLTLGGLLVECAVAAEVEDRKRFDRVASEAEQVMSTIEDRDPDMDEMVVWIQARWRAHGDRVRARRLAT